MKLVMIAEYALWKNPQGLYETMRHLKMCFEINHQEKGGFIVVNEER